MTGTSPERPAVSFRRATVEDWPAIWRMVQEVVAAGNVFVYDPDLTSEQAVGMWIEPEPNETWLAHGADGGLLGAYRTGENRPGPGSHIATATYLVGAAARGRGVGRAMVEHSLDRARERGYRGMQYNAVAETNVYAIKLYLDLGFIVIGAIPGGFAHPDKGYVDLLIMYRDLLGS